LRQHDGRNAMRTADGPDALVSAASGRLGPPGFGVASGGAMGLGAGLGLPPCEGLCRRPAGSKSCAETGPVQTIARIKPRAVAPGAKTLRKRTIEA
jgi:hypothetical protein